MIVKLIAPGIIPNDYVTVDLPAVPQRDDTVLIETPTGNGEYDEELLTVLGVTYSVELTRGTLHHGVCGLPEVTCGRTDDATLPEPPPHECKFCHRIICTNDGGKTWWHSTSGLQVCFDVYKPEIATPIERN